MRSALHWLCPDETEYTFAVYLRAERHDPQRIAGQQGEAKRDRQDEQAPSVQLPGECPKETLERDAVRAGEA